MARRKPFGGIKLLLVALILFGLALSAAGCTQVEHPPALSADDVVGFWIGPSTAMTAELLQPPPPPTVPLDDIVGAFNLAHKNAWVFEPAEGIALNVVFLLGDGSQVLVSMSPEFPDEHAVIGVRGEALGSPQGVTWYWVKAPSLVRAAGAMARDTLDLGAMMALDPSGDWFYGTRGLGE